MSRPHSNASEVGFGEGLRAMFYLISPSESMYEHPNQVPNYVVSAVPHFWIMIIAEIMITMYKGKNLRINDRLTSVNAGMYSEILGILGLKAVDFYLYSYVYTHYCLYDLPWNSYWTWIIMALLYDLMYYWFHRAAHEINILWMTHQMHHSSEEYFLTTALRQSAVQTYASLFFYLPAALFVPPSQYLIHRQLNLLYQFWIHTELVDSLGPLEYILNTPSHHRVHHGRNPYCIDKNYAACLIIWDRMFGTFEPERKEEKVVYGLVHPVNTFDSNGLQFRCLGDLAKRFWGTKGVKNKLFVLLKGPGWTPGSPRLGNPEDLPKIKAPVVVYDPKLSPVVVTYVLVHSSVAFAIYTAVANLQQVLPAAIIQTACVFLLVTITCSGYLFDKRSFAYLAEFVRCTSCALVLHFLRYDIIKHLMISSQVLNVLISVFAVSSVAWSLVLCGGGFQIFKEKTS